MSDDILESPALSGSDLAAVTALIDALSATQARRERLEEELKITNQEIITLTDSLIPDKLRSVGLRALTMTDGRQITIKAMLFVTITEARKSTAYAWLHTHGLGDIIKTEAVIRLLNDSPLTFAKVKAAISALPGGAGEVELKESIHPATLKACIREQVDNGNAEFYSEETRKLFGMHEINRAVIK